MKNEQVRQIMTKKPTCLKPNDSIKSAVDLLLNRRIHLLPVVDENDILIGVVTDMDIKNRAKGQRYIKEIMDTKMVKITPLDKVGTATELFLDKRFHSLPVVNLKGELKGMVSPFDILKYMFKQEYKTPILYREVLANAV